MATAPSSATLATVLDSVREEAQVFLCDLIRRASLPGREQEAVEYAAVRFAEVAEVEHVPLSDTLIGDPDYSSPVSGLAYQGRHNLRILLAGAAGSPSLLFNTHLDVVPASDGQQAPFDPRLCSGAIYGRGACDAKGQVAALYAALLVLRRLNVRLRGDVIAHLVVEEEVGGNGTLAMIRRGAQADACVVLEPTELRILSSVRGAVWFRLTCLGKPGHSGRAGESVSALKMAIRAMEALERYHAELLAASRNVPLFDRFENPMPITFGTLHAGDWPATAPASAVVEGVMGFLPNRTREQVMREMRRALEEAGDPWLRENFRMEFTYRHDAHVLPVEHPLVTALASACRDVTGGAEITAMTASCDSWYYNNQLRIPTVVFGAGSLGVAHSNEEHIRIDDVLTAAAVLARLAELWCGVAS